MLRVTIEITNGLSFKKIGSLDIINDGTGNSDIGNYRIVSGMYIDQNGREYKFPNIGKVLGHIRDQPAGAIALSVNAFVHLIRKVKNAQ